MSNTNKFDITLSTDNYNLICRQISMLHRQFTEINNQLVQNQHDIISLTEELQNSNTKARINGSRIADLDYKYDKIINNQRNIDILTSQLKEAHKKIALQNNLIKDLNNKCYQNQILIDSFSN